MKSTLESKDMISEDYHKKSILDKTTSILEWLETINSLTRADKNENFDFKHKEVENLLAGMPGPNIEFEH